MQRTAFPSRALASAHMLAAVLELEALGCTTLEYRRSNPTYHRAGSWHAERDTYGRYQLAADMQYEPRGHDDVRERNWLRDVGQKVAQQHGLSITAGLYGRVAGHSVGDGMHMHIDAGDRSNVGDNRGPAFVAPWAGKPTAPAWPVRAFQRTIGGLTIDGACGPATTRAVQKWAAATPDGVWGPLTTRAVQRRVGAGVDGLLGPETCYRMGLAIEKEMRS